MVMTTTPMWGAAATSLRVASMPGRPGMARSISAMSGCSSSTASTPDAPSAATPAPCPAPRARRRPSPRPARRDPPRMSLTVVGSIAFDAVETETGKRDRLLGGSAVHFSLASSFFADTRVVGPVGDDFGEEEYGALRSRGVITDDIEHVPGGKTFFWAGRYERDVNIRHTLQTDLTGFDDFASKRSYG